MLTTSLSLLEQLREPARSEIWERFVRLYTPLLVRWATLQGLQPADADDLAQTILMKLLRLIPTYERRQGDTFRGWLFTMCRNECRDFQNRRALQPLPGDSRLVAVSGPAFEIEEAEYRRELVDRTLEMVRADFSAQTWEAFQAFVLENQSAASVAAKLGLSVNAVYLARHRVLSRVQAELAGLLD